MKDYYSTTLSLDRNIGKILTYLDKNDLTKNTIVVYTSDQGFYMGEHGWFDKRFMYEESMRTPLIIRYPGIIKPGTVSNQMISNVDFAPTFLEAAGLAIPNEIQGKSTMPLFKNVKASIRNSAYYHFYEFPGEHSVLKDPNEMKNLYGLKNYSTITQDLKEQLKQLCIENKDKTALKVLAENF